MGMTKRGSTALRTCVIRCSRMSATIDVHAPTRPPARREKRASPVDLRERVLDAGGVVVGHHHVLEEVAPGRDGHGRGADAAGADHQDPHDVHLLVGGAGGTGQRRSGLAGARPAPHDVSPRGRRAGAEPIGGTTGGIAAVSSKTSRSQPEERRRAEPPEHHQDDAEDEGQDRDAPAARRRRTSRLAGVGVGRVGHVDGDCARTPRRGRRRRAAGTSPMSTKFLTLRSRTCR